MFTEFLNGFAILISYFVFFIFIAVLIRVFIDIPTEIFRKTLHTILLGSTFVLVYGFDTWWIAAIASLSFIVIAFPILTLGQRIPGLSKLLTERNTGELRRSMISIFSLFAFLILLCWGILGERYLVLASIFAWGFGDAAAALVGKHFGKHKLEGKMIEGKKSLEGCLAMFLVSFVSVLVILLIYNAVAWYAYFPISLITAAVCTTVELYTKGGMDTVTCPLAAAAVLIPLVHLWGG